MLLVVAGQDHGVAGEVGRVAVVVEVIEVGEQQHRVACVDFGPRRLPGCVVALVEGAQLQRRPGQLVEVLLQPRRAAVEPAGRRGVLEDHVVEAGARPEPEGHLLADLDPVEGEQVAQCGRAAVVAGRVDVAGNRGHDGILTYRLILRADARRRSQAAAPDADPRALARNRVRGEGAGQGRQQRRGLGRARRWRWRCSTRDSARRG